MLGANNYSPNVRRTQSNAWPQIYADEHGLEAEELNLYNLCLSVANSELGTQGPFLDTFSMLP